MTRTLRLTHVNKNIPHICTYVHS